MTLSEQTGLVPKKFIRSSPRLIHSPHAYDAFKHGFHEEANVLQTHNLSRNSTLTGYSSPAPKSALNQNPINNHGSRQTASNITQNA